MTKPACPRWFEAEALCDGRLAGAERLSFQRHLASCPHCSREVAALQALRDRLCNSGVETDADELHVRRERTRLLAAFDTMLAPPERTKAARGWLVAAAAASLLLVGLFGYFRARRAARVGTESSVVVHAEGTASWSRRSEGAVEKILLERGVLSIRVDHIPQRPRLLVVLPDGELEDIGTRFTVSAEASRTTRVSVESGSVVLRIRGQAPLSLGAGETWHPSQPADGSACPSCEPPQVAGAASAAGAPSALANPAPASSRADGSACLSCEPPRVAGATSVPPAPLSAALGSARSRPAAAALASSGRATSPPANAPGDDPKPGLDAALDPALDFRTAMSALDSGDNFTAATRFSSFLSAHPGDARCEDAAYLRVIALQRTGNVDSMKKAAAHYLRRYPNGFRRAEVAALAQ